MNLIYTRFIYSLRLALIKPNILLKEHFYEIIFDIVSSLF